jgi:adenylyl- and sulfurtransferase ThiI
MNAPYDPHQNLTTDVTSDHGFRPLNSLQSANHCGNGIYNKIEVPKADLISTDVLKYIELLEDESFAGWSVDEEKGYRTACISITKKIKELKK